MPEIVRCYRQKVPASRFIGIRYGEKDRVNLGYSFQWHEWLNTNRFASLTALYTPEFLSVYEDGGAHVGLMRWKKNEPFEYWIGMFLPAETVVPDGFDSHDFPAADLGVCWVRGSEANVYFQEENCNKQLQADGMRIVTDEQGAYWFFERYAYPRFIEPDENGEIILDICHFIAE
ncbi:MAG TPA: hypothetical protein PK629_03710 [Oscillospiraceae bacterium]|nr:hypothetical protein [Oscillospiraceae bacterium]HPF56124.1 hypothetical protein [Clostridiales bacterium]HPK35690.1 hypothetical protein [Oscillospiraceae bacterium]HPR76399.1 hypothetical protein [Oscillospiraceae bacterium]